MVVVVAHPVFVAGRRAGGLDASDQALVGQDTERVVHRLAGDGADLRPHRLGHVVRGAVRPTGHRPQHGQTLGRDLEAVVTQKVGGIEGWVHRRGLILGLILDLVKY